MDIQTLKSELVSGIVEVVFTKVNGERRVMECTLNESYLPARTESKGEKKVNDNVLSVWDTKVKGWRSFRLDSVISHKAV